MKVTKNKNYNGIVCQLADIRPHSNADRLQVANALGYQVIVGSDAQDGDVGIVFPEGGKLSHEMLLANCLYRKHPETGEAMGGYFEASGRIKTVKLRGESSEAFFTSLDSVAFTGLDPLSNPRKFSRGTEIGTIGSTLICDRHYTKATLRAMRSAARAYRKPRWVPRFIAPLHKKYVVDKAKRDPCPTFKKHFDTNKLRLNLHNIPQDCKVVITSKCHGTSGRTGLVKYDNRSWLKRLMRSKVQYS